MFGAKTIGGSAGKMVALVPACRTGSEHVVRAAARSVSERAYVPLTLG